MLSTTPLPQEKSISRSHQGCHSNCTVRSGLRFMWDAYQHDSYRIGLFGVLLALPSRQLQSSLVIGQNPLFLCQHMVLQVKHSSPKLMFPLCKGPRQLFSSLQIPNMAELLFFGKTTAGTHGLPQHYWGLGAPQATTPAVLPAPGSIQTLPPYITRSLPKDPSPRNHSLCAA